MNIKLEISEKELEYIKASVDEYFKKQLRENNKGFSNKFEEIEEFLDLLNDLMELRGKLCLLKN